MSVERWNARERAPRRRRNRVVAPSVKAGVALCCVVALGGRAENFTRFDVVANASVAQEVENGDKDVREPLDMKRIFASGEFSERGFDAKWAPTGAAFVKRVASSAPCGGFDIVAESPDGTRTPILDATEIIPRDPETNAAKPDAKPISVDDYALSDDRNLVLIYSNSKRVWRRNTRGDYWILDRKRGVFRRLGGDFARPSSLQFAKISPDGTRVAYVFDNNLYAEEILNGRVVKLTTDGDSNIINGTFDWVCEEEFDCRDGFRWSPDGKKIAFWRLDTSREPTFVMLDDVGLSNASGAARVVQIDGDFQTVDGPETGNDGEKTNGASDNDLSAESATSDVKKKRREIESARLAEYPKLVSFKYPRVGCSNATAKIGIATLPELGSDSTDVGSRYFDFGSEVYLPGMEWFSGASGPVVQATPRSQRRCDAYLLNVDSPIVDPAETDANAVSNVESQVPNGAKLLFSDVDPTAWQTVYPIRPLRDGDRFLRTSERDGWRRLYLSSFADPESLEPLTLENADAIEFVAFDYDASGGESGVYYYASPESATRRFLYRASLGGENERVEIVSDDADAGNGTSWGFETWNLSADSRWAICRRSAFGVPSRIDLLKLDGAKAQVVKTFEDNAALREKLAAEKFGPFEFFTVEIPATPDFEQNSDSEDAKRGDDAGADSCAGVEAVETISLDGWAILPPDWNPNDAKRYPVLIYVYGEPAGQTALDSWGGSTYLYHRAISQRGVVVLTFDNRGTPAPKGREWRKSIYRKMGALGRSDQAAALRKFLATWPFADKLNVDKIGVWGWSGGGTSTLNLMFNYPDLYKCGIAVAPVADYRNYDTIYQERYSGLIDETPESYALGSPIEYAEKLTGSLLLIHGTGDDNCHYQTSEQLINRLIAAGKDFDAFAYPFRSHGIFEGAGSTLHLREKTMKFWERNLFD